MTSSKSQMSSARLEHSALVRAPLATLLQDGNGPAHSAFTKHFMDNRLKGDLTTPMKKAIVDIDPRTALSIFTSRISPGPASRGGKTSPGAATHSGSPGAS
jgi:hypothetical protein